MSATLSTTTPAIGSTEPAANRQPAAVPGIVRIAGKVVVGLSILNLLSVFALLLLLHVVSEEWWVSIALTYLPRAPYLLPSLFLSVSALCVRRRWVWINLFSLLLVSVPVMGLRVPLSALAGTSSGELLTVVSCNIQGGSRDLTKILAELEELQPDVVVLQEANERVATLLPFFEGWSRVHRGEYFVASRYPVTLRDINRVEAFHRTTAILCEIDGPNGPFLVCDVHLTTARYGLSNLRLHSLASGVGVDQLSVRQDLRAMEAFETRAFASQEGFETPLLVMGDFNTPTSSSLFQKYWNDLSSAFDVSGFGYGYTSPCTNHARWPSNTPWLRIDHILSSSQWTSERCWIGKSDGSDHRLIAARLRLATPR